MEPNDWLTDEVKYSNKKQNGEFQFEEKEISGAP